MTVYHYVPVARLLFYLITILFHAFLLVRSVFAHHYLFALLLAVPVTAVSVILARFVRHAAVRVLLNDSEVLLETLLYTTVLAKAGTRFDGRHIIAPDGRKFIINPAKAGKLADVLEETDDK